MGSISHRIEKELHQYIKTHLPDYKLRYVYNINKPKQQFLVKDPQRRRTRSNVVYRHISLYESFYIELTRRNLVTCLEELQSRPNSEVCYHLQSNPTHKVDFHNPQIFISFQDKHKLSILEHNTSNSLNLISTSTSHLIHSAFLMLKRHGPVFIFHISNY